MVHLKAIIKHDLGKTRHSLGTIKVGELEEIAKLPLSAWVEIEEGESGVYLYRYSANGECVSDTWHASVNEAIEQAEFEFDIKRTDWEEIED